MIIKDLKFYYFGFKIYERNEKLKMLKMCMLGCNLKKVWGMGKERIKEVFFKKFWEISGFVEDVEIDMFVVFV